MTSSAALMSALSEKWPDIATRCTECSDTWTFNVPADQLLSVAENLRDAEGFQFHQLMDVCGVDYSDYGRSEWCTHRASSTGFSRAVSEFASDDDSLENRYAVIYQLLSTSLNHRLRLKVHPVEKEGRLCVPSVLPIWSSANWYEREAFDLFGIVFEGHPDLRRLLTDYGFVGHPFRKDFPLSGQVEIRYDATKARCVYEPVSIQPRVLVPKVIPKDVRYSKHLLDNK